MSAESKPGLPKLVRDGIPSIIQASGDTPVFHIATDAEFGESLNAKLLEEARELIAAKTVGEATGELADVLEVLSALVAYRGIDMEEAQIIKASKANLNGAFDRRIVLDRVDEC